MNEQSQWTVYRTRFLVRARRLSAPLVFTDIFGREQSGKVGDYLVESSGGFRRIAPRAIFEDIYVALENTQPKASAPERLPSARPPQSVALPPESSRTGLARHSSSGRQAVTAWSG